MRDPFGERLQRENDCDDEQVSRRPAPEENPHSESSGEHAGDDARIGLGREDAERSRQAQPRRHVRAGLLIGLLIRHGLL